MASITDQNDMFVYWVINNYTGICYPLEVCVSEKLAQEYVKEHSAEWLFPEDSYIIRKTTVIK